jgi:hypothetical protein
VSCKGPDAAATTAAAVESALSKLPSESARILPVPQSTSSGTDAAAASGSSSCALLGTLIGSKIGGYLKASVLRGGES